MKPRRFLESKVLLAVLVALAFTIGCGGGSTSPPPPPSGPLSVSLSTAAVVGPKAATPGSVGVPFSGTSSAISLSVTGSILPSGVIPQFSPAAGGLSGPLFLTATSTTPSGTYSANVVVTDGI